MKTLKKYAYQSPETEILSLEAKRIIMDSPIGDPSDPNQNDPPNPGGGLHAPWRF